MGMVLDTMESTLERGLLTLTMPMVFMLLVSPSDHQLDLTHSPRVLMPPPKDMLLMLTMDMVLDTMESTTERGLLTPTMPMVFMLLVSPSDHPPDLTQSPKVLMLPPRDLPLMPMDIMDLDIMEPTLVKYLRRFLLFYLSE